MTDCNVELGADYGRGYYAALDHICHFINALDSSEMTARDVRSAIYGECLSARPRISPYTDEDVERVAAHDYAAMRAASPDQTNGLLREDAEFLCARIRELEGEMTDDGELSRQYFGHVLPAVARMEDALTSTPTARIEESERG